MAQSGFSGSVRLKSEVQAGGHSQSPNITMAQHPGLIGGILASGLVTQPLAVTY